MSISIVPIEERYAEGFHACLDSVARERRYLAQIEAPPVERVREFVRQSVADNAAQFVAIAEDLVVGWSDIFPGWAHAVQHCGTLGMGVRDGYRGLGVGRQLLSAAIAKSKANGITRIVLEVRADNIPAVGLYESMGFVQETNQRNAMRFDGVYYDAVRMSLVHEPAA